MPRAQGQDGEKLEVKIDNITFSIPRWKFNSGKEGYYLRTGFEIHGRKSWVQLMILDTVETPEQRLAKTAANRARHQQAKARRKAERSISEGTGLGEGLLGKKR